MRFCIGFWRRRIIWRKKLSRGVLFLALERDFRIMESAVGGTYPSKQHHIFESCFGFECCLP